MYDKINNFTRQEKETQNRAGFFTGQRKRRWRKRMGEMWTVVACMHRETWKTTAL